MSELPAHASPALTAFDNPQANHRAPLKHLDESPHAPPPALLSPAFTPPSTPGTGTPALERDAPSIPLDTSAPLPAPDLLKDLPTVECMVRARIPTTTGQEMFLHLYHNDIDSKEHLAIVFGSHIRSKTLDAPRPGETERDRMTRGAYIGRLYPGRTNSGMMDTTSKARSMQKDLQKSQIPRTTALASQAIPKRIPYTSETGTQDNGDGTVGPTSVERSSAPQAPLVRIHSECYTGETVWSARCDCGEQLDEAARLMSLPSAQRSGGVIVYLRQEGRGIGLGEKLKAYNLQDLGNDTVEANLLLRHPADARSYGLATAILVDLGLGTSRETRAEDEVAAESKGIRLLTNNPDKIRAIEGTNREVIVHERVPMVPLSWRSGGVKGVHSAEVDGYLRTKIEKMGHMLPSG